MKEILESHNKLCTGCEACTNICPVDAIKMIPDIWGFLYPVIDHGKCIGCKKCETVCPKLHPNTSNDEKPACYAAAADDRTRFTSSSGGVFSILSDWVLSQDGVVCGAAFDSTFKVIHKCIDRSEDLEQLKKSKYVQSEIGFVYREIAEAAKKGKKVLFVGTPCQVGGLNNYLIEKNLRESVILVDFLCGGNPSPKMFRDYLNETFDVPNIEKIDFREKDCGWKNSTIFSVTMKNGENIRYTIDDSAYEKAFHLFMSKRECCMTCEFCGYRRQGDITIGDYWGIDRYDKSLNDGKGLSVIFVNNETGRSVLESTKQLFENICETPLSAARYNSVVVERKPHPMRRRFFSMYPGHSFTKSVEQCMEDYHDVAVVGNIAGMNYGSHLTHYALYSALTDMGFTTTMLNVPQDSFINAHDRPELFAKDPYPEWDWCRRYSSKTAMKELNNKCDAFVTGSDQQFVSWMYNNDGRFVTQPFVTANKRKITYAASLGHDCVKSNEQERATISYYLKKFDAVSVREDTAVALFDREFGVSSTHVLDPVFLMSMERYKSLIDNSDKEVPDKPYLFTYIMDATKEKERVIRKYAEENDLEVCAISDYQEKANWDIPTIYKTDMETWLKYFYNSSFVITDSFHGTCLAMIFHKQFFSIINKRRGSTRFESLFRFFELQDKAVYNNDDMKEVLEKWTDIDYKKIEAIMDKEVSRSRSWLKEAIVGNGKKKSFDAYDILDYRIDDIEKRFKESMDDFIRSSYLPIVELITNKDNGISQLTSINDIYTYLLWLKVFKDEIDIFITVKDTPGYYINEQIINEMKRLGLSADLYRKHWHPYIAVISKGKVLTEMIGAKNDHMEQDFSIDDIKVKLLSKSFKSGNLASTQINGIEHSVNNRGVNIVTCNAYDHSVIDSVAFDTHTKELTCFR